MHPALASSEEAQPSVLHLRHLAAIWVSGLGQILTTCKDPSGGGKEGEEGIKKQNKKSAVNKSPTSPQILKPPKTKIAGAALDTRHLAQGGVAH